MNISLHANSIRIRIIYLRWRLYAATDTFTALNTFNIETGVCDTRRCSHFFRTSSQRVQQKLTSHLWNRRKLGLLSDNVEWRRINAVNNVKSFKPSFRPSAVRSLCLCQLFQTDIYHIHIYTIRMSSVTCARSVHVGKQLTRSYWDVYQK